MGVTIRQRNNIPKVIKQMNKLGGRSIKVGIFGEDNYKYGDDADLITIARVHEFGANIKPVRSQWLTIPLLKEAKGKKASDFGDELFFREGDNPTYAFLSRTVGKGSIENVFILLKSVKIPERSFIRGGFDNNYQEVYNDMKKQLAKVVTRNANVDVFLDAVGLQFAGMVQQDARSLNSPPNSKLTIATKRSSNPLMDTGRMVGAITYKIEQVIK